MTLRDERCPGHWSAPHPNAVFAFSTRAGGVSEPPFDTLNLGRSTADRPEAVEENRRRLLRAIGLDPARLVTAGQNHGARVARAVAPGLIPDCDALVTTVPGLALAVTAADCLPLVLVAPGAVAAVHSGWRGTAAGIPRIALAALCEVAHVSPDRVDVHLGPAIRSCCYRVGPEVAERFPAEATSHGPHGWSLDLATATRLMLLESSVAPERIADCAECTSCRPDRYFSHRRDRGRTGRQWGLAALGNP